MLLLSMVTIAFLAELVFIFADRQCTELFRLAAAIGVLWQNSPSLVYNYTLLAHQCVEHSSRFSRGNSYNSVKSLGGGSYAPGTFDDYCDSILCEKKCQIGVA